MSCPVARDSKIRSSSLNFVDLNVFLRIDFMLKKPVAGIQMGRDD